jgi:hypothetical protein
MNDDIVHSLIINCRQQLQLQNHILSKEDGNSEMVLSGCRQVVSGHADFPDH